MTADVAIEPAGQFPSTIKPFTAMVAMVKFLINKEDTSQVFRVFDAIDGPQTERNFRRFEKLPEGKRIIEREIDLAPILRDRDRLARLPANTLGGAYYTFTQAEGLNADGLVYAEQAANVRTLQVEPARRRFISSGFQLHDIWHVLGGYGRDAVGEACVLAFSYGQLDIIG
ncbi:MAG TPA: Coq4 family protein, partial [Parvularculaceae bacterium]|nr:Coq4 family protein [Parvularculaceae bacterium]